MNCGQVQTNLAEDVLSRTDEDVASHLSSCPECRRVCEELLELEDLSRSLSGQFRVPTEFRDRVLARLDEQRARRWRRFGLVAAVLIAGVIVAAFVRPWDDDSAAEVEAAGRPIVMQVGPPSGQAETGSIDYVDVVVSRDGTNDLILRVPSVIEIHRTQLQQEDFYINNVSH